MSITENEDDARREVFFTLPAAQQQACLPPSTLRPHLIVVSMDATKIHAEGDWPDIRVGRVIAHDAEGQRLGQKSFGSFLPVEEVGRQLFLDAHQLGWAQATKRVVVGDGSPWIWQNAAPAVPRRYTDSRLVSRQRERARGRGGTVWARYERGPRLGQKHLGRLVGRPRCGGPAKNPSVACRCSPPAKREALWNCTVRLQNNAWRTRYPEIARRLAGWQRVMLSSDVSRRAVSIWWVYLGADHAEEIIWQSCLGRCPCCLGCGRHLFKGEMHRVVMSSRMRNAPSSDGCRGP